MIATAFNNSVNSVLEARLRDRKQRELVVASVMSGFSTLHKKPVPDMDERLKMLEERVRQMAESIHLGFINGRLVVNTAGSSERVLKELRHGTDWYEPWDKVDETVLAAILTDPAK